MIWERLGKNRAAVIDDRNVARLLRQGMELQPTKDLLAKIFQPQLAGIERAILSAERDARACERRWMAACSMRIYV